MTWLLAALLVASNLGWLALLWGAGRRIVQLERLLGKAADALEGAARDKQALLACLAAMPRGKGN